MPISGTAAVILLGAALTFYAGVGVVRVVKATPHAVKHAAVAVYHKVHHPPKTKE